MSSIDTQSLIEVIADAKESLDKATEAIQNLRCSVNSLQRDNSKLCAMLDSLVNSKEPDVLFEMQAEIEELLAEARGDHE